MSYRVEQINPWKLSRNDWLDIGRVVSHSFEYDPLFMYVAGPKYQFSTLNFESIVNPRERLDKITRYQRKVREWARILEVKCKTTGHDCFVAYDDKTDKIVGICEWEHPDYMVSGLENKFHRQGLIYNIRFWCLEKWYWLVNKIEFGFFGERSIINSRYHSIQNSMSDTFASKRTDESTLAKIKDYNKVGQHIYPRNKMLYLSFVCVDGEYQGKGVGKQLLKESLASFPYIDAAFEHDGEKATGPQQFDLEASEMGTFLYYKFGFEKIADHQTVYGDTTVNEAFMVKTGR